MDENIQKKGLMQRICEFIVDKRLLFMLLFAALLVFSVFSIGWIRVETDLAEYLPEDAEAKRGLNIMADEFTTYGTARILLEDVGYYRAAELAEKIADVEGVARVEFDNTPAHMNGGDALFDISFSGATESEEAVAAIKEIRELLPEEDSYVYSEVGNTLVDIVVSEMGIVVILVAIVVVAVLIFTSSTYMEIPVLLITFIAAAVVNMGTNFLLGTISFISNAVAIVLQLALSVDYAIILCNRYKEEHKTLDRRDAAVSALRKAMPEISASSLTTIAGLTAMTFMKFRLGFDMGISLIKSIVCSLLTVFLLMPGLLVLFGKGMDRTGHKNFVPKVSFVGKFAYATRFIVPILFIALVIGAYSIFSGMRFVYSEELTDTVKHNSNQIALAKIEDRFGVSNMLAVLVPAGDYDREAQMLDELSQFDEVSSVMGLSTIDAIGGFKLTDKVNCRVFSGLAGVDDTMSQALFAYYAAENGQHNAVASGIESYTVPLVDLFLFLHDKAQEGTFELEPAQTAMIDDLYSQLSFAYDQLQSKRYSRLVTTITLPMDAPETYAFIDSFRAVVNKYYGDAVLVGQSINSAAFNDTFDGDNMIVSLVSIVLVMLILFFTFRSVGMPILLILVIQGSIWINFALARLSGSYVFFMCYLIVSAIQMGANIDYAIVISSRFGTERACGDMKLAAINTMNFAFPTIITSGSMMVVAGLLVGLRVSEPTIAGIGLYVGTGTIITLILVMFVLPQLLLLGNRLVAATTITAGANAAGLRRGLRSALAILLALSAVFGFLAVPKIYGRYRQEDEDAKTGRRAAVQKINELQALSDKLGTNGDTAYSFAESLVTDSVGQEQLAEGEEKLAAGQEQYDAGRDQLAYAKSELAAGEARVAQGQADYDEGARQLEEAKAAYAAGEAKIAQGQAEYDEGARQLEEAKAAYAAGEALMAAVKPVYDIVMPLYQAYLSAQANYDAALASGDPVQILLTTTLLTTARVAFEAQLGGYSIGGLLNDYQSAQQQLTDASAQIAEGQARLDAGKAELDAGKAELAAAKQQIAEGEQQLQDAKTVLDDGYRQLDDAKRQIAAGEQQLSGAKHELDSGYDELDAGRKQLEENYDKLLGSMEELDSYTDENEKLKAGIELIADTYDLPLRSGSREDYDNVLKTAKAQLSDDAKEREAAAGRRLIAFILLLLASVSALLAALLALIKRVRGSIVTALVAALLALACLAVWFILCSGGNPLFIAAAIAVLLLAGAYMLITASMSA